jgi:hypothetical protein
MPRRSAASGFRFRQHTGGQRPEHHDVAGAEPRWKADVLYSEHLYLLTRRADTQKHFEEVGNGLSDLASRRAPRCPPRHKLNLWAVGTIFAASRLVEDSTAQPDFEEVRLGFTHC